MFRTFETFLVKAAENLLNKIFCLGLVRQEKPPGRQETAARQAARLGPADRPPGRQEKACRPGPNLKAAAKGGPARPMQSRPGLAAWEHCLEALVRATGESGRFACGFRTDLHFADGGG
jgi:hypothetical protein